MTSRSRWPVWALCAVALAVCLAVVFLTKPRGPGSERAPVLATPGSDLARGEPNLAPLVSNRRANDPGAPASEAGSRRPLGGTNSAYQPVASASAASREAAELVASMTPEQLLEAVKGTNMNLQAAAAFAIARQPTPGLLSGLLEAASASSDSKTRIALLSAIASVRSEECLGELVKPLGLKKDGDLQEAARTSLLRSSSPAVVDALIARAEGFSSDEYLCREIARTLASVRGSAAVTNLLAGGGLAHSCRRRRLRQRAGSHRGPAGSRGSLRPPGHGPRHARGHSGGRHRSGAVARGAARAIGAPEVACRSSHGHRPARGIESPGKLWRGPAPSYFERVPGGRCRPAMASRSAAPAQ